MDVSPRSLFKFYSQSRHWGSSMDLFIPGPGLCTLALRQEFFKEISFVIQRRLFQLCTEDLLHGLEHVYEIGPSHHLAKLGEWEAANLTNDSEPLTFHFLPCICSYLQDLKRPSLGHLHWLPHIVGEHLPDGAVDRPPSDWKMKAFSQRQTENNPRAGKNYW